MPIKSPDKTFVIDNLSQKLGITLKLLARFVGHFPSMNDVTAWTIQKPRPGAKLNVGARIVPRVRGKVRHISVDSELGAHLAHWNGQHHKYRRLTLRPFATRTPPKKK